MIQRHRAIWPVSTRTGDDAFVLMQIDNVDGVDVGTSKAGGRSALTSCTVDVAVLAG